MSCQEKGKRNSLANTTCRSDQEEMKVKTKDKKITQPVAPSLVLAFQVQLNKETSSHGGQL